ncbi:hypothetical protein [Bacillus sp. SD075]|nr:hypothetical protein [Bacillus sp. SD075]
MIMKIRDLDTDYSQQLFKLQKEAYKVEAEMIKHCQNTSSIGII